MHPGRICRTALTGNGTPIFFKQLLLGFCLFLGFVCGLIPLLESIQIDLDVALSIKQLVFKVIELFALILGEFLKEGLAGTNRTVVKQAADVNAGCCARLLFFNIPFAIGGLDVLMLIDGITLDVKAPLGTFGRGLARHSSTFHI